MLKRHVEVIGSMPPFYKIAEMLWGKNANFNSDGNSDAPNSTCWFELTLQLRLHDVKLKGSNDENQRIDIDPIDDNEKFLVIKSTNHELVYRTASYLIAYGAVRYYP